MSTTVQDIVNRGQAYNIANNTNDLISNSGELIARVSEWEREVFMRAAQENRFFLATTTQSSTAGTSLRSLDLSTVSPRIDRLVRVGVFYQNAIVIVNPVDMEDAQASLTPRYWTRGQTLYEWNSDWSVFSASGAVSLILDYAYRPAPLNPAGAMTQVLTLPDDWTYLLENRMARYLARKDVNRDPIEIQELDQAYQEGLAMMLDSLDAYQGAVHRRFLPPNPKLHSESGSAGEG